MTFVADEWENLRKNSRAWKDKHPNENYPLSAQDVVDMMKESFSVSKIVSDWYLDAPLVMKILTIMTSIAATSAFAERTFSLARRLKTYLRSQMKDGKFRNVGILAWYDNEEVRKIIDFVQVGNDFIGSSSYRKKMMGLRFVKEDFTPKQFDKQK